MFQVDKEAQLLPQLIEWQKDLSRTKAKEFLQRGRILVNGKSIKKFDYQLHPGDTLEIGGQTTGRQSFTSRYIRLLYEDRHLMVVQKREGILSMSTSHHSFCVKDELDRYLDQSHQPCRSHIVHRLDRETSGLMIYAKSHQVQQLFQADWKSLVYDRRYIAVVKGQIKDREGTINSWLKDDKFYFTYSSETDNGGKWAQTHFSVLKRGRDNTLVELRLDTGRKNQIRVHLSDIGHPVLGDRKYSDIEDAPSIENTQPIPTNPKTASRLFLHAYKLYFIHPVTKEDLHFETPIPKEFLSAL